MNEKRKKNKKEQEDEIKEKKEQKEEEDEWKEKEGEKNRKEQTLSNFATERNFLEIRLASAFQNAHSAQTLFKS